MKKEIKVETNKQIELALLVLMEKLKRVLPFEPSQIVIKNGEITVKE